MNSGISVAFSYISRDFYNALNARDESLFYEKIELFFAFLVLAVPVAVYYRFTREKLSIYWREALTALAMERYFSRRTFFLLEGQGGQLDNPDQRIAEDIRTFTKSSLDLFISLLTALIDLASFSAILLQIYPPLFAAIVAYAGVGSLVTTSLGRSLVKLNFERLSREATFRFSLFRARENAEAIAFYDR
jgi:putative ATP-binding cassette transporter